MSSRSGVRSTRPQGNSAGRRRALPTAWAGSLASRKILAATLAGCPDSRAWRGPAPARGRSRAAAEPTSSGKVLRR